MEIDSVSEVELEVMLESSEILRPSIPTPADKKNIRLCLFDQITPLYYNPILLVYKNNTSHQFDIDCLRHSLMETLSRFYPLAGRCKDESTLWCDDQGILFNICRVNNLIGNIFNESPLQNDFLSKLFPPHPTGSISEMAPLAIQVNMFACGGMAIGCYKLHKLIDGSSFGTFLKYWAGLSIKHNQELVQPDFNAGFSAFPPSLDPLPVVVGGTAFPTKESSGRLVAKRFVFRKNVIRELILKATSEQLPNPTRFEAITGFIWKHAYAAACTSDDDPIFVSFATNIRIRLTPPLPEHSIGNLSVFVKTRPPLSHSHTDFSTAIHDSVTGIKDIVDGFTREDRAEAIMAYIQSMRKHHFDMKPGCYRVANWCNLGHNDADFGLGKPIRVIPYDGLSLPAFIRNVFILTASPDGIDVSVFLEENHMKLLESDPSFLAFAASC